MLLGMKYFAEDNINVCIGDELVKRGFVKKMFSVLINKHLS